MHRFYAGGEISDGKVSLSSEDSHHALHVLRLHTGDSAELFINGKRFSAVLCSEDGENAVMAVGSELPSTETHLRITLFQGLPKADKMDMIVQKAVELGAAAVVPVAMERSIVKLNMADGAKKQQRWQKIAREACKQSGRCVEMTVCEPVKLDAACRMLYSLDAAIVPWEEEKNLSLSAFHSIKPDIISLGVVIGPEGGISEDEIKKLSESGCIPVTLGKRILRTETAGLCAMSALFCLYGDME